MHGETYNEEPEPSLEPYKVIDPGLGNHSSEVSSGRMGIVNVDRISLKIIDPNKHEVITTISSDGRVSKDLHPSSNPMERTVILASHNNEATILTHLVHVIENTGKPIIGSPNIFLEADTLSMEYVRGVDGSSLHFDNINTALEVARLLVNSDASLVKRGVAYLDVKPANFKVQTDARGHPLNVTYFDFGNAALLDNEGNIVPNNAHKVAGFPPEVLGRLKSQGTVIQKVAEKFDLAEPVNGHRAAVYALGQYFNVLFQSSSFSPECRVQQSEKYKAILRLIGMMTEKDPYKRPSLKEIYHAIEHLTEKSQIGSCVKPDMLGILKRRGEIPLSEEILVSESSMKEVLDTVPNLVDSTEN
jgi:serine/threonine protein kinase